MYPNEMYKNEILRDLKTCLSMHTSGTVLAKTKMKIIEAYNRNKISYEEYNQFRIMCDSLFFKHGIIPGVFMGQDIYSWPDNPDKSVKHNKYVKHNKSAKPAKENISNGGQVKKLQINHNAYCWLITPSNPQNVEQYLVDSFKDVNLPNINMFLVQNSLQIPTGQKGNKFALKLANEKTNHMFDLEATYLIRETVRLTDSFGKNCIVLRIYNPKSIPKNKLPNNYEWKLFKITSSESGKPKLLECKRCGRQITEEIYNNHGGLCLGCSIKNGNLGKKHDSNKGCFIATATYGDYNHPKVIEFRKFRDNILSNKLYGRIFIRFYYLLSPQLSKVVKNNKFLKKISKVILNKIYNKIQNQMNCH